MFNSYNSWNFSDVFFCKSFCPVSPGEFHNKYRSAPSTNSKILGVFPKGFEAQVLSNAGGW